MIADVVVVEHDSPWTRDWLVDPFGMGYVINICLELAREEIVPEYRVQGHVRRGRIGVEVVGDTVAICIRVVGIGVVLILGEIVEAVAVRITGYVAENSRG